MVGLKEGEDFGEGILNMSEKVVARAKRVLKRDEKIEAKSEV